MRKFLTCGLIATAAIVTTALQVCAEPPPKEPVIVSTASTERAPTPTKSCGNNCPQPKQ